MGRAPLFWRRLPPPPGYMPRAEPIKYEDIGMSYLVHSGKDYKRVKVTAQMVGHKYGEFVLTRKVRARARASSLLRTPHRLCFRAVPPPQIFRPPAPKKGHPKSRRCARACRSDAPSPCLTRHVLCCVRR